MPGRPLPARMGLRKTRHRDDSVHAEQAGDADRIAQVLGVFGADLRVRVQRVAVAVQAGDRHSRAVEGGQVLAVA